MTTLPRYLGSLLGMAAGDALGTTVEFKPLGSFKPLTTIVGGGPFGLPAGAWTDDTSMALCLAESLCERNAFDPVDQLERYVRWYRHGHLSSTGVCFDIGNTTRAALETFERTHAPYCGSTDATQSGNGSLMRLTPVPLRYAVNPRAAVAHSGDSSRTTHGSIEAVDACRYMAGLIVGALQGRSKDVLLAGRFEPVTGLWAQSPLAPKIDAIAGGSFKGKNTKTIRATGYVAHSLEAALWAFHGSDNFRDGVLMAVNLGDDADTTGAIYGQLAGAYYGVEGIPAEWLGQLVKRDTIEALAARLHALAWPA
ncbi:MAG: ADP-ribosylglycohydrolase family protein [Chloroflexi bacterium]|nr:ADP-ribosylglycohydrolase family protein [Chloroflexota bacterium]